MKTKEDIIKQLNYLASVITDAKYFLEDNNLTIADTKLNILSEKATDLYNDFQSYLR